MEPLHHYGPELNTPQEGEWQLVSELERMHTTLLDVQSRIENNPACELDSYEASILYEVDKDLPDESDDERQPDLSALAQYMRSLRSPEQDMLQVSGLIKERLRGERYVMETYQAAHEVSKGLGLEDESIVKPAELMNGLKNKIDEWDANGLFDYLAAELIGRGARYDLVATPNIEATETQIVGLAEAFGEKQPYKTLVDDEVYRNNLYSAAELSGAAAQDTPIRLSLIPSKFDDGLGFANRDTQLEGLKERQAEYPRFNVRVPSVLDGVAYWYTLRAHGDPLDTNDAWERTSIRHFDLEPKSLEGLMGVPHSFVNDIGRPALTGSYVAIYPVARLALG